MENYLLNNLVIKFTDPWPGIQVSYNSISALFRSLVPPSLLVAAKAEDLDNLEAILSEIVAEYTLNEKLIVFLVDGVKANILNPVNTPAMQNAWVLNSTSYRGESFVEVKKGVKMTKQLLKNWLDYQISSMNRLCPDIYEDTSRMYYKVVRNNNGEFKVWFEHERIPLPHGWEHFDSHITDSIQEAIDSAKGFRAEYLERVQQVIDEVKNYASHGMESWFDEGEGYHLNDDAIIKHVIRDLPEYIELHKGYNLDFTGQISPTDTIKTLRDCWFRVSLRNYMQDSYIGIWAPDQPYTDASIIKDIPNLVKAIEYFGSYYNLNFDKRVSPTDTVKTLRDRMLEVFLHQAGLK